MEVLTEWTTSLVSSALHLKGLSQQEIFWLNKIEKKVVVFITFTSQTFTMQVFHFHQLTMRFLHYSSASALVPSSAHGWT